MLFPLILKCIAESLLPWHHIHLFPPLPGVATSTEEEEQKYNIVTQKFWKESGGCNLERRLFQIY
jgi:hypothetical protein